MFKGLKMEPINTLKLKRHMMNGLQIAFFDVENKFLQLEALIKALHHDTYQEDLTYNTYGLIMLAASLMDEFRILLTKMSSEINYKK